jgi:hypothetical protein
MIAYHKLSQIIAYDEKISHDEALWIKIRLLITMCAKPTSVRITAYISKEYAANLEKWAAKENRTISNLAATILQAAIESNLKNDTLKENNT